ncbi:hypothetical protein MBAV_000785 [Candidatus Magnetobacterium bavaricum]|uniref:Uncharacterized protein n=1 Tax=Candidatus Magnetobacterium bavaricum TaxID=29290 RepID=A0A0F3H264_9BACT|nr:hypothetical protein MBAV_000785 [Candidatus Magnetobacterium bavaricum]
MLDDALTAYDAAIEAFPRNEPAQCGRAEVLRELGMLDDALTAYDAAIAAFPRHEPAQCGRAEVLRQLGRLDEALNAYDAAIAAFPRDVTSQCGRAEVLRELGRLEDALTAYDAAIAAFPNDVAAQCGRAEVLRELGRLDDALTAYDAAIAAYPNYVIAQCGRAGVLLLLGRHTELRESLPIETPVTKSDWIAYHIVSMSYLKEGDVDEAIRRLQYGADNVRWPDSRDYFVNALGFAKMKGRRFEEAIDTLEKHTVQTSNIQKQLNLTLIGHCNAAIGRIDSAIAALNRVSEKDGSAIYEIPQLLRRRYNLSRTQELSEEEAANLDDEIANREFIALLAA